MKKIFLVLAMFLLISSSGYAQESDNITLLTKKGFFERHQQSVFISPCEEVRRTLLLHLKYSNSYDLENLKSLYADSYVNADGFGKDIYFDLIKKTWESYPDIKYRMDIKNIEVSDNTAVVHVDEYAIATTDSKSGLVNEKGLLESSSDSIYYLEKINNEWLMTSDHIVKEKTFLGYGSAKYSEPILTAPCQIPANTQYTSSLKLSIPKDSLVIASIGRENITYPQTVAEEVFRKFPESGILERVFTSNNENINEYAVASFGITKAEVTEKREIKISITGLGFAMSRVNVIPKNEFIKTANKDEKSNDEKNK